MRKLAAQLCMPSAHVIVCLIGLKVLFTMCVLILLQYNIKKWVLYAEMQILHNISI